MDLQEMELEDPSPAESSFSIDAVFVEEPEELGCGCGSVAGGRGGLFGVLLLGLAVLRQRGRREPHGLDL